MEGPRQADGRGIDVVRGLTSGGYFEYHGEVFDFPAIKMTPAPMKPIPILVGGHSDAALRRAVRRWDGWLHAGGDGEELDRLLEKLAKLRAEEGRAEEGGPTIHSRSTSSPTTPTPSTA